MSTALGFSDPSSLGGSVSTAQVAPTITASVGSGTVLDVANLTLRLLSDDTSNALARASAGTLLAGDSGAGQQQRYARRLGDDRLRRAGERDERRDDRDRLSADVRHHAPGISVSGLVGVAQNAASATGSPTLTAQTGGHNTFHAGNILIESDSQDSFFDPGHANLGTSATATTTGGGGLVGAVGSVATTAHDLTETSSVGPGSSLNATGNITIENTSGLQNGFAVFDAQATASGDAVGGLASEGTTNATVTLIDQYTAAVDSDPANPTTVAAGGILTVENTPLVKSASSVESQHRRSGLRDLDQLRDLRQRDPAHPRGTGQHAPGRDAHPGRRAQLLP